MKKKIEECNKESGLHIQLVEDEPKAFAGMMAHYGKFSGVTNYIALVGKKGADLEEKCGYYGEKLTVVISIGYGNHGARLATAMESFFSMIIMLTHFFGKKSTIKIVLPRNFCVFWTVLCLAISKR